MPRRPFLILASVSLFASACADTPSAPVSSIGAPTAPRLGLANAPAESGNVLRYTDNLYGIFIADPESGLILVSGAPTVPSNYWMCPGGTEGTSTTTHQEVVTRDGVVRKIVVGKDVTLTVYRYSDFVGGDPLSFICGATPIATGTGRVMLTDNDYYGTAGRVNTAGIRMHGTVTMLASGERLNASGDFHITWVPFTDDVKTLRETVRLR
jgi:hypothetical protein